MNRTTNQLFEIILECAIEAGPLLLKHQPTIINEQKKGAVGASPDSLAKTVIDEALQELVLSRVIRKYPHIEVNVEEETPLRYLFRGNQDPICLHVDPCDGTLSYVDQRDEFCASYGISHQGKFTHCVLHLPKLNRVFTATPDGNAVYDSNGRVIHSENRPTPKPIIYHRRTFSEKGIDLVESLGYQTSEQILSSHHRITEVATGKIAAFLYCRHKIHDSCLPAPFLINARGQFLNYQGAPIDTRKITVSHKSGLPEYSPIREALYLAPGFQHKKQLLNILSDSTNLHPELIRIRSRS